jgi:hypothetical protein
MTKHHPKLKRRPKRVVELEVLPSVEMIIKIEADQWRKTTLIWLAWFTGLLAASFVSLVFRSKLGVVWSQVFFAAAWFFGAFAIAGLLTVAMFRFRWFSRLDISMRHLPERYRPSSAFNAFFWLFVFLAIQFLHIKLCEQQQSVVSKLQLVNGVMIRLEG